MHRPKVASASSALGHSRREVIEKVHSTLVRGYRRVAVDGIFGWLRQELHLVVTFGQDGGDQSPPARSFDDHCVAYLDALLLYHNRERGCNRVGLGCVRR